MSEKPLQLPPSKLSLDLLEKRLSKKLSQHEMAKELDVSYPEYVGIEEGTYELNLRHLTKIARYLEIEVKEAYLRYIEH